jgi:hypothetical protein
MIKSNAYLKLSVIIFINDNGSCNLAMTYLSDDQAGLKKAGASFKKTVAGFKLHLISFELQAGDLMKLGAFCTKYGLYI